MSRVLHMECPSCRGAVGMSEVDRLVACGYCGAKALVRGADFVPEYVFRPRLDRDDARRVLQRALGDRSMPDSLVRKSRFHSARLHMVPFHELTARRIGTLTITERGDPIAPGANSAGGGRDTRVVMGDVERLAPAVRLPGWALRETDIKTVRTESGGETGGRMEQASRGEIGRLGRLHAPSRDPADLLGRLGGRATATTLRDETEFAEVRVKRIYYPVWRLRYRFRGRLYSCTVDGVTGKLMGLRAPQADRHRVIWMLGALGLSALLLGKTAQGIWSVASRASGQTARDVIGPAFFVFAPLLLLLLAFLSLLSAHAWDQFRRPGELLFEGERREVIKLGRDERTLLDRVFVVFERVFEELSKVEVRHDR